LISDTPAIAAIYGRKAFFKAFKLDGINSIENELRDCGD